MRSSLIGACLNKNGVYFHTACTHLRALIKIAHRSTGLCGCADCKLNTTGAKNENQRHSHYPLVGATPDGGWDQGFEEEDNLHSLVEVITDEGVVGLGSVYTSAKLVEGALGILRPMLIGESAIEPVRVCENLHQSTFWQGRGGSITHAISGIDIALWDIFGKVTGQPISRLLGGRYRDKVKPYGSR